MEWRHLWKIPDEQLSLYGSIQKNSPGFRPFNDSETEQTVAARFQLMVARYHDRIALKGPSHTYT